MNEPDYHHTSHGPQFPRRSAREDAAIRGPRTRKAPRKAREEKKPPSAKEKNACPAQQD